MLTIDNFFERIAERKVKGIKQKVLTAFIEQVVQLDNESDYQQYLNFLKAGKTLYCIKDTKRDAVGKVYVTIRKQYNNNVFPE